MANWFYYDNAGQKQGPITGSQLKQLAAQGVIVRETYVETEDGRQGRAGKINGLTFLLDTDKANNGDKILEEKFIPEHFFSSPDITVPPPLPKRQMSLLYRIGRFFAAAKDARCWIAIFMGMVIVSIGSIAAFTSMDDNLSYLCGLSSYDDLRQMFAHSGKHFGSIAHPNDVETEKSEFMNAYAHFCESSRRTYQFLLGWIVVSLGTFLICWGLKEI